MPIPARKRQNLQSKVHWLCAHTHKVGLSPCIQTYSENQRGVLSDMEVKIKILAHFNFIISSTFHVSVKILHDYLLWALNNYLCVLLYIALHHLYVYSFILVCNYLVCNK